MREKMKKNQQTETERNETVLGNAEESAKEIKKEITGSDNNVIIGYFLTLARFFRPVGHQGRRISQEQNILQLCNL